MQNELTTIYIVRHGQSEANVRDIIGDDMPLSEEGEKQAEALSEKLKDIHFDAFFSSDLLRAKRTAEIIARDRNLEVIAYKELRERNYGAYEGATGDKYREDLKEVFEEMKSMSYEQIKKHKRYHSYETDEQIISRYITFIRELAIAYKGKTILIGSHASLMRVLLLHLGYMKYKVLDTTPISNTGYIKLESDGIDFFMKETSGIAID